MKFIEGKSRQAVRTEHGWGVVIAKVRGGYMVLRDTNEYRMWRNQK